MPDSKSSMYIPGNVPSKKNSKQIWWKNGAMKGNIRAYRKKGNAPVHPFITNSDLVKKYQESTQIFFLQNKIKFRNMIKGIEKPLIIYFYFIRSTRHRFDFNNANHLILDLMQAYGWIEDDDCKNVIPVPKMINGNCFHVDKKKAGTIIEVQ